MFFLCCAKKLGQVQFKLICLHLQNNQVQKLIELNAARFIEALLHVFDAVD